MPDFEARFTQGVTTAVWTDPPFDGLQAAIGSVGGLPAWDALTEADRLLIRARYPDRHSRLNPNSQGAQHQYFRTTRGAFVQLKCTPNGLAEGSVDALLGGRLFSYAWVEAPSGGGPPLVVVPGFSAIIGFTPALLGGYLLGVRREGGGAVYIHLRVES